MALRAGYYGVKKNVLSAIAGLSGAKIIKTIGDGLKLTSAGKLSCDIDNNTMEFKAGKLAAKPQGAKHMTYTGDGQGTSTIDFSELDTLPTIILAISGSSTNGFDVSSGSIVYGNMTALTHWTQREGSQKSSEVQKVTYTDDNKKMHITGSSADTAMNTNGVTWDVYYL